MSKDLIKHELTIQTNYAQDRPVKRYYVRLANGLYLNKSAYASRMADSFTKKKALDLVEEFCRKGNFIPISHEEVGHSGLKITVQEKK